MNALPLSYSAHVNIATFKDYAYDKAKEIKANYNRLEEKCERLEIKCKDEVANLEVVTKERTYLCDK